MNTPILIPMDEIIYTLEHPYCGDATCPCNTPLCTANAESVAYMMATERGLSLPEARQTLRITTRRLGDDDTATYDGETHSLSRERGTEMARGKRGALMPLYLLLPLLIAVGYVLVNLGSRQKVPLAKIALTLVVVGVIAYLATPLLAPLVTLLMQLGAHLPFP